MTIRRCVAYRNDLRGTLTFELIEYFLLHCPTFSSIRNEFFKVFDSFVENQKYGLKFMELSSSTKLQFLIDDIGYAFSNEFGIFYDVHGKMFLNECFKLRFYAF
jgi:hypothetical protein